MVKDMLCVSSINATSTTASVMQTTMFFPSSSPLADRFLRRRRCDTTASGSSGSQSPPPSDYCSTETDSHSSCSQTSTSTSSKICALLIDVKTLCGSRTCANIDVKHELPRYPDDSDNISMYLPTGDSDSECPSPWAAYSHECECTSRSTCLHSLRQHIDYLQSHEWRCVPRTLISAYHVSTEEYASTNDALCLPEAKLARARAEYNWAIAHLSDPTRLWAPRFQERLLAAEAKIATAEKDLEAVNIRRRERAQLLMDIGRF